MIDVSIVIVCMNNLKNLYPCLDSIKKYTKVSYEVLVNAYLFSKENLQKVRDDFPWVTFIESNEIRGFSENNNLALKHARGKYCFVLNDDTEFNMPCIDMLMETFSKVPDNVAIVSPRTIYPDGRVQTCGRPYKDWKIVIKEGLHLYNEKYDTKYTHKDGIFQSYNIIGAAFMIKTDIFKSVGWFDERYFFAPEDFALSTLLNKKGYACYVNADVDVIHYEGMTGKTNALSLTQTATRPAGNKGKLIFYSDDKKWLYIVFGVWMLIQSFAQFLVHGIKGISQRNPNIYSILAIGDWRTCMTLFSNKTPKEIFTKYFLQIQKDKK